MIEDPLAPPRSKVVDVAEGVLVSLVVVLLAAAVPFGAHLANVPNNVDRATEETNQQPPLVVDEPGRYHGRLTHNVVVLNRKSGLQLVAFYTRDVVVLVAILLLIGLLIRTLRRLRRGSSGARNIAVILAGVVALASLLIRLFWGGIYTADLPTASYDFVYGRFEQASTPEWAGALVR